MGKPRVAVLLKETIGGNKSQNKSADLVSLIDRFNVFVKKLHGLIAALKRHHHQMVQTGLTRAEIAQHVAMMTHDSPIAELGRLPDPDHPEQTANSFGGIHMALAAKSQSFADKYNQFVIDYVVEWERIVSARVSNGIKVCDTLRRDLDHYQKKVESLRLGANQALAKGKMVDGKSQDKLNRNEEKLTKAKQDYDKVSMDLCLLLEEIVERSWKDLHPVLVKLSQFDSTLANEEATALSKLGQLVGQLKTVGDRYGVRPQARLKDLQSTPPSQLYSKEGGYQAAIANEAANGGVMGGSWGDNSFSALPPGAVAPQGMGGYPLAIANDEPPQPVQAPPPPSSNPDISRQPSLGNISSFNSTQRLTTSDMLAISNSAAPPPTMEQVNNASQHLTIHTDQGPYSGGLPPAYLSPNAAAYGRATSMASEDSYPSVPSAPAPAAPPPPPPAAAPLAAPPPPPPGDGTSSRLTMYSNNPYEVPMANAVALTPVAADPPAPAGPWTPSGTTHTQSMLSLPTPTNAAPQLPRSYSAAPASLGGGAPPGAYGNNPFSDPPSSTGSLSNPFQTAQSRAGRDPPSGNPFHY